MITALLIVLGVVLYALRVVGGALLGQEAKGAVPDAARRRARRAAALLPEPLAAEYEHTWLAELDSMRDRPLKTARFARGLPRAARAIVIASGAVPAGSASILSRVYRRTADVSAAALALIVLSPLMGAIVIAIRLTSRGPVLFHRMRQGAHGVPFFRLEFRTMYEDLSEHPPALTPIGRVLRPTSLETLPLFWNVLRGEMSLIGPPTTLLRDAEPLDVRPGIISWEWIAYTRPDRFTVHEARWRDRHRTPWRDTHLLLIAVRLLMPR